MLALKRQVASRVSRAQAVALGTAIARMDSEELSALIRNHPNRDRAIDKLMADVADLERSAAEFDEALPTAMDVVREEVERELFDANNECDRWAD